jgi:hypothetical protein
MRWVEGYAVLSKLMEQRSKNTWRERLHEPEGEGSKLFVDRYSAVGIATRYLLDGLGIESRWGASFSAPVQSDPGGLPSHLWNWYRVLPGVKLPGRGVDHPPHQAPRLKKEYSPTEPSLPVLGWTLTLPLRSSRNRPGQAQGVPGRLRPRISLTFGVTGRQPYAPVAFTSGEIPGTHFQRLSRLQGTWFHRSHGKNPQRHHRESIPGPSD